MQTHQAKERSPWAIVSLLLVVVLFALFWIWQKKSIPLSSPLPEPSLEKTSSEPTRPDLSSLEASAVNIVVPSFESLF